MAHFPPEVHAAVRVLFHNAVASGSDYTLLGLAVRAPPPIVAPDAPATFKPIPPSITPAWAKQHYAPGPTGTGAIIQLTLTTVHQTLDRPLAGWEIDFLTANAGGIEYNVAAMWLGLNCLSVRLLMAIEEQGLLKTPIQKWIKHYKGYFTALRRCPALVSDRTVEPQEVYMVRKILNCAGRKQEEADFPLELVERFERPPIHVAVTPDGHLSRSWWINLGARVIEANAKEMVKALADPAHSPHIQEWWDSRWGWMPSGATSDRHALDQLIAEDPQLSKAARGGKKEVCETRNNVWIYNALASYPTTPARVSTKHEPGEKQRALFATNDCNHIVTSYASLNVEKSANIKYMRFRQTAQDVVEWVNADLARPQGSWWLSLDYPNFNSDHEHWMMAMHERAIANAWNESPIDPVIAGFRSMASDWVAEATMRQFVYWPKGMDWKCAQEGAHAECNPTYTPPPWDVTKLAKMPTAGQNSEWPVVVETPNVEDPMRIHCKHTSTRVISGLFSGHRNTAKSNTEMHQVYSEIDSKMMAAHDPLATPLFSTDTGDDEDSLFEDWIGALHYYLGSRLNQFHLKPPKQEAGSDHEYLQRQAAPSMLPMRPLFAMLAQVAAGNWYTDVHIWYDNAIASINDKCWEMHTRGMPVKYARRLATAILNATMRVPKDNKGLGDTRAPDAETDLKLWHQLEWWMMRHGGKTGYHPLWADTGGNAEKRLDIPNIAAKPAPPRGYATHATQAWVTKHKQKFPMLDPKVWEVYEDHCRKDSHGKIYVKQRARAHQEYAIKTWQPRVTKDWPEIDWEAAPPTRADDDDVRAMIRFGGGERRPATVEEVASRFGADVTLIELGGGFLNLLSQLPPAEVGKYEMPLTAHPLRPRYTHLDSAIQSWLKINCGSVSTVAPDRLAHAGWRESHILPPPPMSTQGQRLVHILLAPNGGGKTYYVESHPAIADMDDIVRHSGLFRLFQFAKKMQGHTAATNAAGELWTTVLERGVHGVATQYHPDTFIPPHQERHWVAIIHLVIPPRPMVEERLRIRNWTDEMIQRRLDRWYAVTTNVDSFKTLSTSERRQAQLLQDWPTRLQ